MVCFGSLSCKSVSIYVVSSCVVCLLCAQCQVTL